ncbi:MAG: hypothetical protein ACXWCH_32085, partial [Burkholderiales bacterium]
MNVTKRFAGVLLTRKRSRNKRFRTAPPFATLASGLVLIFTIGPLSAAWFEKDTPGERFRKAMKTREQMCASRKLVVGDTSCDILKLKPADPLETPEGRYAHSIRLPHQTATNVFVKGMTSEQYFSILCARQAGEFISSVVKDVGGVVQMRPRERPTHYMLQHLYALEDPFGSVTEGDAGSSKHGLLRPSRYRFVDRPLDSYANTKEFIRLVGMNPDIEGDSFKDIREEKLAGAMAAYGFTWRGLDIPNGREHGIVGSELIVLNIGTGEVLAVRRGF